LPIHFNNTFCGQGYVQGMNLIAGIFVWHGDEVSSLQLFNWTNSKLNFVELFKPGIKRSSYLNNLFFKRFSWALKTP